MPPDPPHARKGLHQGRSLWTDWLDGQRVVTTSIRPLARATLVEELEGRDLRTLKIKAAGSGHSTSPVARPRSDGLLVQLEQLLLDFPSDAKRWWKPDAELRAEGVLDGDARLWRTRAGISIRKLNEELAKERLGMPNLGSYDAQTLAGAVATATHGSGLATGPLCDLVASIELVTVVDAPGGPKPKSYRIEPNPGPTDRAAFDAEEALHGMELVQDDHVFRSAVVSMGCFGIVTAITLRVVPSFWLDEQRELVRWEGDLRDRIVHLAKTEAYFDAVILTSPINAGGHEALITTRSRRPAIAAYEPPSRLPKRDDARVNQARSSSGGRATAAGTRKIAETAILGARGIGDNAYGIARNAFFAEAHAHPKTVASGRWKSESYVAFRTSIGDYLMASSTEIAFPIERTVEAIDAFLAHAKALRAAPPHYHYFSPIGVRFSRGSEHYLAMQHGRDTCTIEIPVLLGTYALQQTAADADAATTHMLESAEDVLTRLDGRPHWGQRHRMTKQKAEAMYGRTAWRTWLANYERFNLLGTFDNAFTDQMGISRG